MEVALRRRLEGVEHVSISQRQQTAEVTFAPGHRAFSPSEFRTAVGEAEVEVLSLEIDACGIVQEENGQYWITITGASFLLHDRVPASGVTCVTGQLNDHVDPFELARVTALPARLEEPEW